MSEFESPAPLLPEIFALHGRWRGNRDAVVCGDRRQTWSEFSADINRFANALLASGVQPKDHVVVLMSNGLPMVHALFGTMRAGCASVPINLSVSDDGLVSMIRDAGATAIVTTPDQRPRVDALRARLPDDVLLYLLADESAEHWTSWDAFLADAGGAAPAVDIDPDDVLNIIYSSGTTGLPKGIVHTHRGRRDWAYDLAIALRYHGGARTLLTIGLYSNISWVGMLCTLLAGGTIFVHPRFDARAFLETTEAERITHTAMVPIQFQRVVEAQLEHAADVSSMQAMMSAGSPLHEGLRRRLFELFPNGIIELYGLTEGIITTLDPEDAEGHWSSVGKPLLGTDIRIIGDDDREVARGESGEIVSRGRITMPGYLNRPEATSDAMYHDEHGVQWIRTGDIGHLDEDGYLYIVDRKKDMILSGGQNVYPQDIEAVLVDHEEVDDVAVIGLASSRWGETPVALVVPRQPDAFDAQALKDWCNGRVGKQQRIADVIVVDALPRNPNGKILKRELRDAYKDRSYD